jgi:hypothetical protein
MDEPAAGHAAEPAAGLDDEDATTLACGGDGSGDAGGVTRVDADIGGPGDVSVSSAEGRRNRDGDGRTCKLGQERTAAKRRHLRSRRN